MSLPSRRIELSVQLAQNPKVNQPPTFSESGTDTVTLKGSRTSVRIQNSGSLADQRAQVKVWGLTPSLMNQLSTLGLVVNLVPKNTLSISAGDADSGMTSIFSGTIYAAYGDYSGQPDVPFIFECNAGVANATAPATASSFEGSVAVADVMAGLARQIGATFENNGITTRIASPYLPGTLQAQITKLARIAGINVGIIGNTLSIWPRGGNRQTPNVPVISPTAQNGQISYPAFTQQGIVVSAVFNPQITFGSLIRVESSLLAAIAGAQAAASFPSQWAVNKMDLALDALVPKGDWMAKIYGYNPGYSRTIMPPP
jgi:hypothetical protein